MRIAVFIPFFWPERNGLINYVVGLYSEVRKRRPEINITIVTFDSKHSNISFEEESIFQIYRIPCMVLLGGTYAFPNLRGIRRFWKIVKMEKFDVVNTQTRFFISSLMGFFLAKKHGIPCFHTEHGSSFVKDGSLFTRFVARMYDEIFGRLVISSATKLFTVSKSCSSFTKKMGGKNPIVIYNGIEKDFWKTPARKVNKVTIITFCGRMVKGKGVQTLIQVLSRLKDYEWELHLVGDGNYLNEIKILAAKLNLNDRISWHGSQDKNFLKKLLERSDIFVNPSFTEGLPTSVLEAGAMRCAVIATDVGGTREIIDDKSNGILIPSPIQTNIENYLYNSLRTLLTNPKIQRIYGDLLHQKISLEFSWNNIATKFVEYF